MCLVFPDISLVYFSLLAFTLLVSLLAITFLVFLQRKTITAVFGTMALQLIEVFQCSVTYSMKQTSAFFFTVTMLLLISLCVTAAFSTL